MSLEAIPVSTVSALIEHVNKAEHIITLTDAHLCLITSALFCASGEPRLNDDEIVHLKDGSKAAAWELAAAFERYLNSEGAKA